MLRTQTIQAPERGRLVAAPEKIPKSKIAEMGRLLLKKEVTPKTKEAVMMILAHHGCDEALSALKEYNKNPDEGLKFFAQFALDECEMWNEE